MDHLERLVAERDCERLTHRYCRFADRGEASRLAELFTEDGLFELPDLRLRGRKEIAGTFARREALTELRTLHLCTNIDVEVEDETTARGWVNLCLFRRWAAGDGDLAVPVTAPALVATYDDVYARVDGHWLIAARTQHVLFADPSDTGWERPLDR
jgi:hypothetical protein